MCGSNMTKPSTARINLLHVNDHLTAAQRDKPGFLCGTHAGIPFHPPIDHHAATLSLRPAIALARQLFDACALTLAAGVWRWSVSLRDPHHCNPARAHEQPPARRPPASENAAHDTLPKRESFDPNFSEFLVLLIER